MAKNQRPYPHHFYAFDFLNSLNHGGETYHVRMSAATYFLMVKTFFDLEGLLQQFADRPEQLEKVRQFGKADKSHPLFWDKRWLSGTAAERAAVLAQLEDDLFGYLWQSSAPKTMQLEFKTDDSAILADLGLADLPGQWQVLQQFSAAAETAENSWSFRVDDVVCDFRLV